MRNVTVKLVNGWLSKSTVFILNPIVNWNAGGENHSPKFNAEKLRQHRRFIQDLAIFGKYLLN